MANANSPMGLAPVFANGDDWSGQLMLVAFAANNSNNIFVGDPIVPAGGTDDFGVPYVTIATAGATHTVLGAFVGVTDGPAKGGNASSTLTRDLPVYRQASILNYGLVTTWRDQIYSIQEDSVGGAIAAANAGFSNCNLVAGSGSTVTGRSGWMLDSSDAGSGNATYQVKILGLTRGPDNAIGTYAKWLVQLNLWALANGTVGY